MLLIADLSSNEKPQYVPGYVQQAETEEPRLRMDVHFCAVLQMRSESASNLVTTPLRKNANHREIAAKSEAEHLLT